MTSPPAAAIHPGPGLLRGDISDGPLIDRISAEHPDIDATVCCAAKIVVPESVAEPLYYYTENVAKGFALLGHLLRNGNHWMLFSSSARSKAVFETPLRDITGGSALRAICLRYIKLIGADLKMRSGLQVMQPTHAPAS
ncbi:NAD-dependent epimerase/dehydratase family protein [Streptomyces goshikiensis]|uniref:NAD-dependent epimerase/dehydratase family protein n=1 Tax=Streptomyces goshikiensis TaxID=1942 RepID=UPI0036AD26D7